MKCLAVHRAAHMLDMGRRRNTAPEVGDNTADFLLGEADLPFRKVFLLDDVIFPDIITVQVRNHNVVIARLYLR